MESISFFRKVGEPEEVAEKSSDIITSPERAQNKAPFSQA